MQPNYAPLFQRQLTLIFKRLAWMEFAESGKSFRISYAIEDRLAIANPQHIKIANIGLCYCFFALWANLPNTPHTEFDGGY